MNKFSLLFPGQGSQSVGMMQGLSVYAEVKQTFEEASDILGADFWSMITEPNELLNATTNTQPLMLIAGVATWRVWQKETGLRPSVLAGHSLGEFTALVAAGVLQYSDALPLVRFRAESMQNAVPEGVGAMAAILGLDDAKVVEVCADVANNEVLSAVNFNSPGQVVIAGHKVAVERAMQAAKDAGAKRALALPVSVPSHCDLMRPAAVLMAEYLKDVTFSIGEIPVVHNADVQSYQDSNSIKDALVRQLYSPVRWVETIRQLSQDGVVFAAECGPGKVLAGLNKRIVAEMPCVALLNAESMQEAFGQIKSQ